MNFIDILEKEPQVDEYLIQYNKKLEEAEEIVICGAGGLAKFAFYYLNNFGLSDKIKGVRDKKLSAENVMEYKGYPMLCNNMTEENKSGTIYICTPKKKNAYLSCVSDLKKLGIKEEKILPAVDGCFFLKQPVLVKRLLSAEEITSWQEQLEAAYRLFKDDLSKSVFKAVIDYKLTGNIKHLISVAREYDQLSFDDEFFNKKVHNQFLDLGAYDGDTAREYIHKINNDYDNIYCFEPDPKNYKKLARWIADDHIAKITSYCIGAGKEKRNMRFSAMGLESSNISEQGNIIIEVDSVDHVLNGAPVNYIKFDVEGAEYDALLGLQDTIKKYRPTLCVSCYHLKDDIFKLPLLIKKLCPDYRLYMRQYLLRATATVVYAVADA